MPSVFAQLFAQALTLTVADSSEVRARLYEQELNFDATTTPSATLALSGKRTTYTLSYAPSISLLSIAAPDEEFVVFHTLGADATTRFRTTTVGLRQEVGYGQRNFRLEVAPRSDVPEPGDPGDPTDPPPGVVPPGERPDGQPATRDEVVEYGTSTTTLSLSHALSRRVSLSEYAGYYVSTQFGDSRDAYPRQEALSAGSGVSYALTPRDALTTSLEASVTYTEPDLRATIVRLQESYSRQFREDFQVSMGGGVTYSRTDTPQGTLETIALDVGPVGDISATYGWRAGGARYTLVASGGVAPTVDRFTGLVDPRAFWGVSLSRVQGDLTLVLTGTGAHSIDPDSIAPLSTLGSTFEAIYRISTELSTNAGVSATLQSLDPGSAVPPPLWIAFLGLTYTSHPIAL